MFHRVGKIVLLSLLAILIVGTHISPAYAAETYTLTVSPSRIQEANTPGVALTLNVTNAVISTFYAFTWNVTDSGGNGKGILNGQFASGPVFVLSVVYPRDFSGASVPYNGTYRVNVFQVAPGPTKLVATGKFYAGLTDGLVYRRTGQVSVLAQGYGANENITIRITYAGIPIPNFPKWQRADANGILSYLWQLIPVSAPVGNYNLTLNGSTTSKTPPDSQSFAILPTSVSISQLGVGQSSLQTSQVENFTFTAAYPNGQPATTGSAIVRIVEPDGTTFHQVTTSYNLSINAFRGTYQIPTSSQLGAWIAIIEESSFNDGYGNMGPSTSVARGFTVTSSSLPLQVSTLNLLILVVVILAVALGVLVSWVFFGTKSFLRKVLKVDVAGIDREAAKVEGRDFFKDLQEQLKRHEKKSEEARKDG